MRIIPGLLWKLVKRIDAFTEMSSLSCQVALAPAFSRLGMSILSEGKSNKFNRLPTGVASSYVEFCWAEIELA
jgi:hypothetical protein